jgi:hypothetical protein
LKICKPLSSRRMAQTTPTQCVSRIIAEWRYMNKGRCGRSVTAVLC